MLTILRSVHDTLLAHARDTWPDECCGLLAGTRSPSPACLSLSFQIPNLVSRFTLHASRLYVMDARAVRTALEDIDSAGLELLAIYHSHPLSPAVPSREDARQAVNLHLLQVILSLANPRLPDLRAFRLHDHAGSWTEVGIQIIEEEASRLRPAKAGRERAIMAQ